jgi:hypothetical protein
VVVVVNGDRWRGKEYWADQGSPHCSYLL